MTTIASVLRRKDLNLALRLKDYIEKIDKIIFPDCPARVLIHNKASKRHFQAMYTHPRLSGGDYYTVFAKGLHKYLDSENKDILFIDVKKDGHINFPSHLRSLNSFTPLLLAIACHEVRHRMQCHHKIKFFVQDLTTKEKSKLLEVSLDYVKLLFDEVRKTSRKKQSLIKLQTDRHEADAVTIETMVLQNLGSGNQEYIPLLQLGAK